MKRWQVRLTPGFAKQLSKLDGGVQRRVAALLDAVAQSPDPRQHGKALTGELRGYWRYRVGDYRLIVDIRDDEACVIAARRRRAVAEATRLAQTTPPNDLDPAALIRQDRSR